jgi:hypothetical protein
MTKPTLVLLPGLLNTRRLFERQIADLADLVDVVVPELWHYDTIGGMAQAALDAAPGASRWAAFRWAAMSAWKSCGGRPSASNGWC